MVDMKKTLLLICLMLGSVAAVDYKNYTHANVTSFGKAFDYAVEVMQSGTGNADAFGLLFIASLFLGFYIVGSKYTQERALAYACFMTSLSAFLLVSGNFISPNFLVVSIVAFLAAIYFANRVG